MADLITVSDLEKFTKVTYAGSDLLQVEFLIKFGSAVVRRRVPNVDADLASGDLDPDLLSGIFCQMIVRALESWAVGSGVKRIQYPEVETEYYESAAANWSALVYLTDDEIELLTTASGSSSDAFTIRIG